MQEIKLDVEKATNKEIAKIKAQNEQLMKNL